MANWQGRAAVALISILLAGSAAHASPPGADPASLDSHVRILAGDAYEGRMPGTAGEEKTLAYIVEQMKRAGLTPGGKLVDGQRSWFQEVPARTASIVGAVKAVADVGGQSLDLRQGRELGLMPNLANVPQISRANVPVVFAGYGVSAPELGWDDYKDVDVRGKIVLVLGNDPDAELGAGPFNGSRTTIFGRRDYKVAQAANNGALGLLIIHEPEVTGISWESISGSYAQPRFGLVTRAPEQEFTALEGIIELGTAKALLSKTGLDFAALKAAAQRPGFRALPLARTSIDVDMSVTSKNMSSRNVIGLLEGKTAPAETILYVAHWDHIGVGTPDRTGDAIYNGAVDNASGVAGLLEIARLLGQRPRTARSFLFTAVTLEESGLLGSEYYADNPSFPLETTVAAISLDCLLPIGRARNFGTHGYEDSTLHDLLLAAGSRQGRYFTPDAKPEANLWMRSDQYSFAKRGVPSTFFASGQDLVEGGLAQGQQVSDAYRQSDYHRPSDQFDGEWNSAGIAQDVDLLVDLGHRLAVSDNWPEWKQGADFKALREASNGARR